MHEYGVSLTDQAMQRKTCSSSHGILQHSGISDKVTTTCLALFFGALCCEAQYCMILCRVASGGRALKARRRASLAYQGRREVLPWRCQLVDSRRVAWPVCRVAMLSRVTLRWPIPSPPQTRPDLSGITVIRPVEEGGRQADWPLGWCGFLTA